MSGLYNYLSDFFTTPDSFLPSHLQHLSILMDESEKASKLSWEKDGEEVNYSFN